MRKDKSASKALVGNKVIDSDGKVVGRVKDVKTDGPELVSVLVDRGMFSDDILVAKNAMDTIGENIIMKVPVHA